MDEGVEQARLALAHDPLSSYTQAIHGMTCALAGRHADGIQSARRGVELDADSYLARFILQFVLHVGGEFAEAVTAGESALAMSGRHSWSMATLATTLAELGRRNEAEAVYAEMHARARRQYVPPGLLALAAAAAEREDAALGHAHEAYRIRDPHCEFFLSPYIRFGHRLYAYPAFRELSGQAAGPP